MFRTELYWFEYDFGAEELGSDAAAKHLRLHQLHRLDGAITRRLILVAWLLVGQGGFG